MGSYFHTVDWLVVAAYFALVWLISHRVQGRQTGTHEYFLGSRSLPWPAVAASIVSTTISGVTFIGVPALVEDCERVQPFLPWRHDSKA